MPGRVLMSLRLTVLAAVSVASAEALAQVVPAGFTSTTYTSPAHSDATAMALTPDGRIYIARQGGELRTVAPGATVVSAIYTFAALRAGGEQGFIGIAVDPQFATNRFVYAYITRLAAPVRNQIRRVTMNEVGDGVVAGSEVIIYELDDIGVTVHNGGAMHFGADGKLYVAVGEAGTSSNAQSLTKRLGKMLRINADGSIPDDNPTSFPGIVGTPTGANRAIWAVGLRNPFTFAIQPGTGRMHINDVGAGTWEEINLGEAGKNFGWPATEGAFSSATYPNFTNPLFAFRHNTVEPTGIVIAGGAFYNPMDEHPFPASFYGDYFVGDYARQWIRTRDDGTGAISEFATAMGSVVDLRVDRQGRLMVLTRTALRRLTYTTPLAPEFVVQPQGATIDPCGTLSLNVLASSSPEAPSYAWFHGESPLADDGRISGSQTRTLTITGMTFGDSGAYTCVATNGTSSATSNPALIVGANPQRCQPADIAFDNGAPLPPTGACGSDLVNSGVNEGDYNAFFQGYFDALPQCDIADDAGNAPPLGANSGVNEGDYNGFFQWFFQGCPL